MQYRDTLERGAELLRLALGHMAQQSSGLHPVSYAVWYEYVSGRNHALTRELDALRSRGEKLTDETTLGIYMKHVAEIDQRTVDSVGGKLNQVIADITETALRSQDRAGDYGRTLERWQGKLESPERGPDLWEGIESILDETRAIKTSIGDLRQVLDTSRSEVEALRTELTRARQEALVDALSGLLNRKGFDQTLQSMMAYHAQAGGSLALLMIDIDHFKQINDTYGHLFGDRVIRSVAQTIKAGIKGGDIAARFGGEEFTVLLPNTPMHGATAVGEQLRQGVAKTRIRRIDREESIGNITVSVGVAVLASDESMTDFVGRADSALYAAKDQGRNRVAGG
jgi:diguanylate cyclase